MPIYFPRLTAIDQNETKRYAGIGGHSDFSATLLSDACSQAILVINPKGVWNTYPYDQDTHSILSPNPLILEAESIIKHLEGAAEVAVMAVTIGMELEQEVSNLFQTNKYTLGLLLDAAGTAAVESACDAVCKIISQDASRNGLTTGSRFSPGYRGWSIDVQPDILNLASAERIDLSVTVSKMLVPRKSVTAVIGLYPYHQTLNLPTQPELSCDKCGQPGCHARKESTE